MTKLSCFGQVQKRFLVFPTASYLNETVRYNYSFSTTKIKMDRASKGFSFGFLGRYKKTIDTKVSLSFGILYSQTTADNLFETNATTSSTGSNPVVFLYQEVRKNIQVPILIDYNPVNSGRFSPYFSAGFTYSHRINKQRMFFFVPDEKYPLALTIGAGLSYQNKRSSLLILQPFLNYNFLKTKEFSNYRVYQIGIQARVTGIL